MKRNNFEMTKLLIDYIEKQNIKININDKNDEKKISTFMCSSK